MMILISGFKGTIKTITTHHIPSQRRLLVWILIDIDSIWLRIQSVCTDHDYRHIIFHSQHKS